jgi:mevalonate kinase
MLSNKFSGSGGGSCHVTLSARAALTASHSRAATTPTKSPLRTTRTPGMSAIELSSTLKGFAPAP